MANNDDFEYSEIDEKSEIEKLQETIKNMSNFTDDSEGFLSQSPQMLMNAGNTETSFMQKEDFDPYAILEKPVERKPKSKKFVVMINAENIPYFDSIPVDDRNALFNTMLKEHKKNSEKTKERKHLIKFSKHMFVGIMTVIITLPIMFFVVNKSVLLTMKNYKNVQNSFEKLYEKKREAQRSSIKRIVY